MITLLLGAGASRTAGYPLVKEMLGQWVSFVQNAKHQAETFRKMGVEGDLQKHAMECLREGLQILLASQCSTPDEYATRFPNKSKELELVKKGLGVLFVLIDQRANTDEYRKLWANVLSRQFAWLDVEGQKPFQAISRSSLFRVITYNYDTAIVRAAEEFCQEQFPSEYKGSLVYDLQTSETDRKFEESQVSLLHVHGSYAFRLVDGPDHKKVVRLTDRLAPGMNLQDVLDSPCIHFPSEIDVKGAKGRTEKSTPLERYAAWVKDKLLNHIAPKTYVLVVVGFSLHIETWPFFVDFLKQAERLNTVGLVCPWKDGYGKELPDRQAIESKIHILAGEAGRFDLKVCWLADSLGEFMSRPPGQDWAALEQRAFHSS